MYSLGYIKEMNEKAAKKAKGKQPLIFKGQALNEMRIPHFGDYRPKGWDMVETYFVDSSGWGRSDEPALTLSAFHEKMKEGFGYATIEAGQFQVYVGEFKKIKAKEALNG